MGEVRSPPCNIRSTDFKNSAGKGPNSSSVRILPGKCVSVISPNFILTTINIEVRQRNGVQYCKYVK